MGEGIVESNSKIVKKAFNFGFHLENWFDSETSRTMTLIEQLSNIHQVDF